MQIPKCFKHLPERDCMFCVNPVNDIIHSCRLGQCCPPLLRIWSLKILPWCENLASGFWMFRGTRSMERSTGWIFGESIERGFKTHEASSDSPWGRVALGYWVWRLSVKTGYLYFDVTMENRLIWEMWHGYVTCLPWSHLTDLRSITVSAMWICKLYKQSGSLRLATVISKVADGSELRGPLLKHNWAWMHCHPGTFLLSLHSRTFEIHPNHQSESSWFGKGNGCPWALFPRESVFCQMLRRCSTGSCSCCLWVPFSTAEGTGGTFESGLYRVAIGTHITRSDWVQNWLKPDLLIFAAHECVCMCVCSCICAHMCVHLELTCFLPCHEYLLLLPDHIYAPISSEITFSYFQSGGDSDHCLPPSAFCDLVWGWTQGFIQITEHIDTFDRTIE